MRLNFILLLLVLLSCNANQDKAMETQNGKDTITPGSLQVNNISYKEQLEATKKYYPFNNWRESYRNGLEQYTEENCKKSQQVFDNLIAKLIALGPQAKEKEKIEAFKTAVLSLNQLNDEIEGLIETGERESLCELIDQITISAGMNPQNYADGQGIADNWRDW